MNENEWRSEKREKKKNGEEDVELCGRKRIQKRKGVRNDTVQENGRETWRRKGYSEEHRLERERGKRRKTERERSSYFKTMWTIFSLSCEKERETERDTF